MTLRTSESCGLTVHWCADEQEDGEQEQGAKRARLDVDDADVDEEEDDDGDGIEEEDSGGSGGGGAPSGWCCFNCLRQNALSARYAKISLKATTHLTTISHIFN